MFYIEFISRETIGTVFARGSVLTVSTVLTIFARGSVLSILTISTIFPRIALIAFVTFIALVAFLSSYRPLSLHTIDYPETIFTNLNNGTRSSILTVFTWCSILTVFTWCSILTILTRCTVFTVLSVNTILAILTVYNFSNRAIAQSYPKTIFHLLYFLYILSRLYFGKNVINRRLVFVYLRLQSFNVIVVILAGCQCYRSP